MVSASLCVSPGDKATWRHVIVRGPAWLSGKTRDSVATVERRPFRSVPCRSPESPQRVVFSADHHTQSYLAAAATVLRAARAYGPTGAGSCSAPARLLASARLASTLRLGSLSAPAPHGRQSRTSRAQQCATFRSRDPPPHESCSRVRVLAIRSSCNREASSVHESMSPVSPARTHGRRSPTLDDRGEKPLLSQILGHPG
jgi:hypothetical protein